MVFSELVFLYGFLPVLLLLYLLAGKFGGRRKIPLANGLLLIASLLFYAWGEPVFLLLMIGMIGITWALGMWLGRRKGKWVLAVSVILLLLPLFVCKYADFLIENINGWFGFEIAPLRAGLPLGISFYTFQAVSYAADVYRGKVQPQRRPLRLALYICLFPQLVAGPIVRYEEIEKQMEERPFGLEQVSKGMLRFAMGLGKKVLIADVLGELCRIYLNTTESSILFTWLYAFANMLQIYYDFSGYSDMAIGLGKMFGFTFPENFRYPFTSHSITEFWQKWHISLGSWFRDYVYIPLGGNRKGKKRLVLNLMIVWTLTGLWHGASWNFAVWGAYFGVLLAAEKTCMKRQLERLTEWSESARWWLNLILVLISFLIFRADSLQQAWLHITRLFYGPIAGGEAWYYLKSYAMVLVLAMTGASLLLRERAEAWEQSELGAETIERFSPLFTAGLLLLSTAFIVEGSFQPFFYFRF